LKELPRSLNKRTSGWVNESHLIHQAGYGTRISFVQASRAGSARIAVSVPWVYCHNFAVHIKLHVLSSGMNSVQCGYVSEIENGNLTLEAYKHMPRCTKSQDVMLVMHD
jgi:hypothetical protein